MVVKEISLFFGLCLAVILILVSFLSKYAFKNPKASHDLLKVAPALLIVAGVEHGLTLVCHALFSEDDVFGKLIDSKPAIFVGGFSLIYMSIAGFVGCLKKVVGIGD